MDLGLEGKVALVTGGSEGIGRAAAERLAQEGASVVICARRDAVLEQTAADIRERTGGEITTVVADVTRDDDVAALFETTVERYGGLDILVNNAGTAAAGRFEEVSDAAWREDLELKVFGAVRCARAAIPWMRQRGGGRIINLSIPGGKAPPAGTLPTSVSRSAGLTLTKVLANEHAADGILVNAVCIGLIKSGQNDRRFERAREDEPGLTRDAYYERLGADVPLGRVGEAEEAGDVIAFLASKRASYVTGTAINIDGGSSPVL